MHSTSRHPHPPRLIRAAIIAATAAFAPIAHVVAQDATTTAPSTAPTNSTSLFARITAIRGIVQVRTTEDQPWKVAAVGMELDEGAEFRTGPRSAVEFIIPPDQTITLDRLGTIKVLEAVKQSGKVTTALGMKYGRARYDIQAADLEHDSTIRSPGSTLAIRGTDVTFEDTAPFAPSAVSRQGRAMFKTNKRQFVSFGGAKRANVSADRSSPAETALVKTRSDPQSAFSGRSDTEKNLVLQLPSFGGRDLAGGGLPGLRGHERQEQVREEFFPPVMPGPGPGPGPTPTPTPEPIPEPMPNPLAGQVLFDLTWTGMPFTDIDLEVARGGNEVARGGTLNGGPQPVTPSGGGHAGNREADATSFGQEIVLWSPTAPDDYYLVRVQLRNDIGANAHVSVRRDPSGANTSLAEFDIPMGLNEPFFQVHVPIPSDISTPPPPLPEPPPRSAYLPPPQQGPDTASGVGASSSSIRPAPVMIKSTTPWPTQRRPK